MGMLWIMKIIYVNYLNIFVCISVTALHCNGCFWKFSYARWWKTSVLIETLFYTAVPIFFMIMGVTLLDYHKKYCTSTFFKKRLLKTFVPFSIWSCIAIILQVAMGKIAVEKLSISGIINMILATTAMPVYWFFVPLFAVYLSIPVLGRIDEKYKKETYTYAVVVAFITVSVLPKVFELLGINYNSGLNIEAVGGYLIYVFLGYLLEYSYSLTKSQRMAIYVLGFGGWFVRFITVFLWSLQSGSIQNQLGGTLVSLQYSLV